MRSPFLVLAPVLLFSCCAHDPGQDAASAQPASDAASPEPAADAASPEPAAALVEASSAAVDDDGVEEAIEEVSTPGLEQRLFAIPDTAIVIPADLVEQGRVAALERGGGLEKRQLVSVHIPVTSLAAQRWERIEGPQGPAWRLAIVSDGASFLRPHFIGFPREGEARVVVYGGSSDQGAAVVRPTTSAPGPDLWGPVVEGSVLFVEVTTASGAQPQLVVDVVSNGIPRARAAEATCYLDPACYSTWKSTKSGIGLMYFEDAGSGYVCSGALVIDKGRSFKPYFLTAKHCLSKNSVADTLIVFWTYQTSTCRGLVPSLQSVPRTNGSSVKVHSSSSDVSLLLLDGKPPKGTTYLGWTTGTPPANAPITVIHHPDGTWKRISFGKITSSSGNFWRVVYSKSSTEGGSSGSPLLLNSTKQIVGQLFRGDASCSNMRGIDEYGKFSASWTKGLSTYLNK